MKRKDIKPCSVCGKGVMHSGQIQFYRVKIESLIINTGAVQRQHGLELMLGSPTIAHVMGTDEDLAAVASSHTGVLCFDCMPVEIHILNEKLAEKEEADGS